MKKVFLFLSLTALIYACGNQDKPAKIADDAVAKPAENGNPSYDANRGAGKFTKVDIPAALDAPKAGAGEKVYSVKCAGCHKLTDEKLVGQVGKA
jgi:cytochrome c5